MQSWYWSHFLLNVSHTCLSLLLDCTYYGGNYSVYLLYHWITSVPMHSRHLRVWKEKNADGVKHARKIFIQDYCKEVGELGILNLILLKYKVGHFLRAELSVKILEDVRWEVGWSMWLGDLCLWTVLIKVRLLPWHKDWKIEALSFLMITSQRDGSQILKKDTPGLYNWQGVGRRFTSQRGRKIIYNSKVKVTDPRIRKKYVKNLVKLKGIVRPSSSIFICWIN